MSANIQYPMPDVQHPPARVFVLADLSLNLETRELRGPRGSIALSKVFFDVAELLMRRPEALVSKDTLLAALYPGPGDIPNGASSFLRQTTHRLRVVISALGCDRVGVKNERDVGYR